jgi:ATP-binding cassette, subfamily B, bacterial
MMIEKRKYAILDVIRMPVQCAPVLSLLAAVQIILSGIVPTVQVLATTAFLDTAMAVVRDSTDARAVFPSLLAVVGLIAYNWISGGLLAFANVRLELAIRAEYRTAIVEKRARLAYRHIENHESWDLISRVARNPEKQIMTAFKDGLGMSAMVLRVAGILMLLVAHVWWASFAICAFSVPLFALAMKSGRANYETDRRVTKHRRRYEYLSDVLQGREAVEERTLFGYGGRINALFHSQFESARRIEVAARRAWFIRMKSGSLLFGLISIMVAMVLVQPVMTGAITVGLFISLVTAVFSMIQMMSWDLASSVDHLAKHGEYLKDLTAFAALEETPGATDRPAVRPPVLHSLELRNVRFRYPGTEAYILDGLSLRIRAGRHYAIVGENGAGKTTLAKLVTGLYDDFEGEILINGRPIAGYAQGELKAFFSVVYQDFARYSLSIRHSITLGDVNGMGDGDSGSRLAAALEAADLSGIVGGLPHGLDTVLGKIKDGGQDLSGGEWQRIAMARAVINPAPLRILDEPTAALDPLSESRLYETFGSISRGITTVFISHRLGSTKLADEIFVISGGRVAEEGTHRELMTAKGVYAEMYESQRSWYQ